MAACPECKHPISFVRMYDTLRRLVDIDRCIACDCVYALDTPTQIARGAHFIASLALCCCTFFMARIFGMEVTDANRLYFFTSVLILSALIGNVPVTWKAGVFGPVPIRTCPYCHGDMTGEGGLRCGSCSRMLPHSHRPFIHRLGTWVLPFYVTAVFLALLFIDP